MNPKNNDIYGNIANAKTPGDLLNALKRAASGPTEKAIRAREQRGAVKVNPAQLEKISEGCFVTEASSLGWQPGFWPRIFEMNGVLFVRQTGDAGSFLYEQSGGGIMVEVFND
jgi:hypothetical protein